MVEEKKQVKGGFRATLALIISLIRPVLPKCFWEVTYYAMVF